MTGMNVDYVIEGFRLRPKKFVLDVHIVEKIFYSIFKLLRTSRF